MLNSFPSKRDVQIELKERNIEVSFDRSDSPRIVLEFPPAHELRRVRSNFMPVISLREALLQDPFDLKSLYEIELSHLKTKDSIVPQSSTVLNRLSNLYFLTEQREQSRLYLERAAEVSNSDFFQDQIASSYLLEGNVAAARSVLPSGDPSQSVSRCLLFFQMALIEKDNVAAKFFVEAALEIDPIDVDANIAQGGFYLLNGKPENAIRHFRTAIDEAPVSSNVYVNLAVCYYLLGNFFRAVKSLKQAIALNPTNENALIFYSDLLHELNRSSDGIIALRRFLKFEQKSEAVWNRLARSYFLEADYAKALDALYTEASLTNNPVVFNNIAVVLSRMGDGEKAVRYYNLALKLIEEGRSESTKDADVSLNYVIPILKNLSIHYLTAEKYGKALHYSGRAWDLVVQHNTGVSQVIPTHVNALLRNNEVVKAEIVARGWLSNRQQDPDATLAVLSSLCAALADTGTSEETQRFIEMIFDIGSRSEIASPYWIVRAYNNAMFASLQLDNVECAEIFATYLGPYLRSNPFVTATFGLLALKKSKLEKGRGLYREAISLASNRVLKDQIRQRQNFELGRIYLRKDEKVLAKKYLTRAAREKLGTKEVKKQAASILRALPSPNRIDNPN